MPARHSVIVNDMDPLNSTVRASRQQREATMHSPDIRKSADILIEKHGREAPRIAESMADARRASKDYEGCAVWLCVLETINSLEGAKSS